MGQNRQPFRFGFIAGAFIVFMLAAMVVLYGK